MWPIQEKYNKQLLMDWANLDHRDGSLININPSVYHFWQSILEKHSWQEKIRLWINNDEETKLLRNFENFRLRTEKGKFWNSKHWYWLFKQQALQTKNKDCSVSFLKPVICENCWTIEVHLVYVIHPKQKQVQE